ncbi:hypothetical protein J5I95_15880 [Candidatus Poribacteria bacterium]|nr:hypothetical protein [Candidatus Poribacteria bacterium]
MQSHDSKTILSHVPKDAKSIAFCVTASDNIPKFIDLVVDKMTNNDLGYQRAILVYEDTIPRSQRETILMSIVKKIKKRPKGSQNIHVHAQTASRDEISEIVQRYSETNQVMIWSNEEEQ